VSVKIPVVSSQEDLVRKRQRKRDDLDVDLCVLCERRGAAMQKSKKTAPRASTHRFGHRRLVEPLPVPTQGSIKGPKEDATVSCTRSGRTRSGSSSCNG